MNVFDFAMQMEQDGRAYYENLAEQAENAVLKQILINLAEDEIKHYNLFKKMRDGDISAVADMEATGTRVLENAKNVFQEMDQNATSAGFTDDIIAAWGKARDVEKKSEDFYREKADEESDENKKNVIIRIADEEHKHWLLIENVINFLKRPGQWLEDAEWNNFESF
jgi:rubrerythrin